MLGAFAERVTHALRSSSAPKRSSARWTTAPAASPRPRRSASARGTGTPPRRRSTSSLADLRAAVDVEGRNSRSSGPPPRAPPRRARARRLLGHGEGEVLPHRRVGDDVLVATGSRASSNSLSRSSSKAPQTPSSAPGAARRPRRPRCAPTCPGGRARARRARSRVRLERRVQRLDDALRASNSRLGDAATCIRSSGRSPEGR